jgi:transposase-like protein
MINQKITHRYSQAFKQKVVSEVESGKLTINKARRMYNIAGGSTIQTWLRKLGKTHLLTKVIHHQMKDEPNRIKELESKNRQLESALAQAHLKIITLESTLKVLEEKSGVKFKKKTDTASLNTVSKTNDSSKGDTR